jgi:hypothetical protein
MTAFLTRLSSHITYGNVAATMALVMATTGFAMAAGSDTGRTIRACYDKRTGVVHVKKKGKKCGKRQSSLSWNRRGPQGAKGATGTPGAAGAGGATGAPGTARAYAWVNADNGVSPGFPAEHPGFTAVSRIGTGVYCLTPDASIPASQLRYAVASARDDGNAYIISAGQNYNCSSNQVQVRTRLYDNTHIDFADFNIVIP